MGKNIQKEIYESWSWGQLIDFFFFSKISYFLSFRVTWSTYASFGVK